MTNLGIIFLTGVTTGGLSCMAVQGGLLAGTLAQQVEKKEIKQRAVGTITIFLVAKLIAYTILGFLLGWLGTILQLSPTMRAYLQLFIGIFLIGTALRLFNVHPIFRHFIIEPPKVITKYIRKLAKNRDDDLATPAFLGALTIFIPCGVTQAMLLLAMATGNPFQAALIMFAFVLGTSPIFFGLVYMATRLGEKLQGQFLKVAAVVVLILGLISLEGGLNLMGSPISYAAFSAWLNQDDSANSALVATTSPTQSQNQSVETENAITIKVDDSDGYTPAVAQARAAQPLTVTFTTNGTRSCARSVVFRTLGLQKVLPESGNTQITIPSQPSGTTVKYTCSMGMYRGQINFN